MKNEQYIKQYNEDGTCANPIEVAYYHFFDNRRTRRAKNKRFLGNGKNFHLTVLKNAKYKRVLQHEKTKEGVSKTIEHYVLQ